MDMQTARMLARYNLWANRLLFDATAALPPAELTKERQTLFKTIIATLNHNLVVDLIWQAHLEGRAHGFEARNVVLHPELPALWQARQAMDDWYVAWADAQTNASLAEERPFTFIGGEKSAMTRGEMLLHIITHTTYHRGWVAEMFHAIPVKPPTTDLPVYLNVMRKAKAA
jgi:uncharacterized damage-inducible protein DinB